MPRIPDNFRDIVFYLYKSKEDARKGESAGGCGFFVSVASEQHGQAGWGYHYAVTCLHNLAEGCFTIRVNTADGGVVVQRETESGVARTSERPSCSDA